MTNKKGHAFYIKRIAALVEQGGTFVSAQQTGIYKIKLEIIPALPTKEQTIPPIRICILYNPEGSLEALDFQLSMMPYTTSGKHNISIPTINKKILPGIIILSHAFAEFSFVSSLFSCYHITGYGHNSSQNSANTSGCGR